MFSISFISFFFLLFSCWLWLWFYDCATSCWFAEQKRQQISEIKAGLDEADSLVLYLLVAEIILFFFFSPYFWGWMWALPIFLQIRKMDLEARSLQPNVKAVLLAKLREYKSDLNNLKSEVKRIASANSNQAARDDLLESGMADAMSVCLNPFGFLVVMLLVLKCPGD